MKFFAFGAGLACATLMAATFATTADAQRNKVVSRVTVTDDFATSQLTWRGRGDIGYTLRWKTIRKDGEIHICGAVAYGDLGLRSESIDVLKSAYILYDDKPIMKNMRYFNKVRSAKKLVGSQANCASTGVKAPNKGYRVRLLWGSKSFKG